VDDIFWHIITFISTLSNLFFLLEIGFTIFILFVLLVLTLFNFLVSLAEELISGLFFSLFISNSFKIFDKNKFI
jgi:hypothetical protein